MAAHARLSPSGADRWMTCTGSVRLIERLTADGVIPARSSSGAADEGTAAHQVREDCLDLGLDAWAFVGTSFRVDGVDYFCTEDMAEHLQPGIDWLREQPGEMVVEHQVNLDRWLPGNFGTLDTALIQILQRRLIVFDLKYGQGVPVDAVGNRQLRIYAVGILDNFNLWDAVDEVLIVIDQPRAGGFKEWTVSVADLRVFAQEMLAAGRAVEDPDAPLVVTEKGCKWCPVKDIEGGCPARNAYFEEMLGDDFDGDEPELPNPDGMDPSRRYFIVERAADIKKWLAKLHEDSLAAALEGRPDPGSKAVEGDLGDRYFPNKARAERVARIALGDAAYKPPQMVGITDLEAALKPGRKKEGNPRAWALMQKLWDRKQGAPKLVSENHPKAALNKLEEAIDELEDFD